MATKTGLSRRVAAALSACACALFLTMTSVALADDLSDVQGELSSKTQQLNDLARQIDDSQKNLADIEGAISDLRAEIDGRQATRSVLQGRIASLAQMMYKDGDGLNFLAIITNSDSLSDFLDRMEMRAKVMSEYAQLATDQKRTSQELEVQYREISQQKDEQYAVLENLREQKGQLDAAVSDLKGKEAQLSAAQQRAVAQAAETSRQAADTIETVSEAASAPVAAPQANTTDESHGAQAEAAAEATAAVAERAEPSAEEAPQEQQAEEAAVKEEPAPVAQEPEPVQEVAEDPVSSSGWQTGLASAYGGSSDSSTPNPGTTATGAVCDDWSMGVAVPMAWGPGAYYGRAVEISYGGATVVATVNDCGGMGGGARALDLQPGVFKAFGFSTCEDWGVREVQYRFL